MPRSPPGTSLPRPGSTPASPGQRYPRGAWCSRVQGAAKEGNQTIARTRHRNKPVVFTDVRLIRADFCNSSVECSLFIATTELAFIVSLVRARTRTCACTCVWKRCRLVATLLAGVAGMQRVYHRKSSPCTLLR
ncbi:hypothetical protein NP493_1081g01000 [Ridgeia piscesae]|uniref:Uncharacterized protein n=1 Tax=Ridgeia piscesae TaxID=27915 RepID=A0AAD9KGS6_RIDPI|nr:hypothetical protein NP493_1081g01000 [Ridgeia piscesae]